MSNSSSRSRPTHEIRRFAAVERAERTFEHATVRTALEQLIERETAVTRAAGQLGAARQYEQDARGRLQAAAAGVADAEARRDQRLAESNSDEIKALESELLLLQAVDALIVIEALRAEVRALEEKAAEARKLRERAQSARSDASSIDQRLASRVLPTSEQNRRVADTRRGAEGRPNLAPTSPSSPLMPVALGFRGRPRRGSGGHARGTRLAPADRRPRGTRRRRSAGRSDLGRTSGPRSSAGRGERTERDDAATDGRSKWSRHCLQQA